MKTHQGIHQQAQIHRSAAAIRRDGAILYINRLQGFYATTNSTSKKDTKCKKDTGCYY
jgi:hypothetical protein